MLSQLKVRFIALVFLVVQAQSYKAEMMSDGYHLGWTTFKDSITFRAVVNTLGWVAIGFNSQPQMQGADMVLAGFANNKGYIYDLHCEKAHTRPDMDTHQDYKLIWAQENGTHTFVTIRRMINTNDTQDKPITSEPVNVLYAFGEKDANSGKDFEYHGANNKGVKEMVLLRPDVELSLDNLKAALTAGAN